MNNEIEGLNKITVELQKQLEESKVELSELQDKIDNLEIPAPQMNSGSPSQIMDRLYNVYNKGNETY